MAVSRVGGASGGCSPAELGRCSGVPPSLSKQRDVELAASDGVPQPGRLVGAGVLPASGGRILLDLTAPLAGLGG